MDNRNEAQPTFISQFASGKPLRKYLILYTQFKKFKYRKLEKKKKKQLKQKRSFKAPISMFKINQ